jgi:hypothetical protein
MTDTTAQSDAVEAAGAPSAAAMAGEGQRTHLMDIMKSVIADIEERDHKSFLVNAKNADAVFDEMESAGYVFACARRPNSDGLREVYFVREPQPGYRI